MAEEVPAEAALWRRVPDIHWVDDGKGGLRPSSAAFDDDPEGSPTSVIVAAESSLGRCLDPVRNHRLRFAVAAFPAGAALERGLSVKRDPTDVEPAHALVVGDKTRSVRNHLVRASVWAHAPGVPYPPPDPWGGPGPRGP
jgi:hypothetical protein